MFHNSIHLPVGIFQGLGSGLKEAGIVVSQEPLWYYKHDKSCFLKIQLEIQCFVHSDLVQYVHTHSVNLFSSSGRKKKQTPVALATSDFEGNDRDSRTWWMNGDLSSIHPNPRGGFFLLGLFHLENKGRGGRQKKIAPLSPLEFSNTHQMSLFQIKSKNY